MRAAVVVAGVLVANACGPATSAPEASATTTPILTAPSQSMSGSPTSTPEASVLRTSGNTIVLDWERLANPFGPGAPGDLDALAARGAGFIAVGSTAGTNPEAVAIASEDGLNWSPPTPLPGGAGAYVDAVAVGPDLIVAAGSSSGCCGQGGGRALVWTSRDAVTWQQVPDDLGFASAGISAVAAVGHGFVGVGIANANEVGNEAAFWYSPDGLRWSRLSNVPGLKTGWMHAVTGGGFRIVAVGTRGDPNVGPSAAWSSLKGQTWMLSTSSPALAAGVMTAIVPIAGGFAAFGRDQDGAPLVWRSGDGSSWTVERSFSGGGSGFDDGVAVGDRWLAIGQASTPDGLTAGVAWQWSATAGWAVVPTGDVFAGVGGAFGALHAAVSSAPRIVIVGYGGTPNAAEPAIWVSPPGP